MAEKRRRRDMFWDPFEDFDRLFSEMESFPRIRFNTRSSMPCVETHETNKEFIYEFAFPGVKKEDIELDVDDKAVHLTVKHKGSKEVEKQGYKSVSSKYFGFEGVYPIPENTDPNKIGASFKNGVLEVVIPKKVAEKKKKGKSVKIK